VKNLVDTRFFALRALCRAAAQSSVDPSENSPSRNSPQAAALASGMVGRVKKTLDSVFFTPDACDGAQASCDVNEKSSSRISR